MVNSLLFYTCPAVFYFLPLEGSATASCGPHSAGSDEFPSDNDARPYVSSSFPLYIPSPTGAFRLDGKAPFAMENVSVRPCPSRVSSLQI